MRRLRRLYNFFVVIVCETTENEVILCKQQKCVPCLCSKKIYFSCFWAVFCLSYNLPNQSFDEQQISSILFLITCDLITIHACIVGVLRTKIPLLTV